MPNFRPLASLAWKENEVMDACVMSLPIPIKNFQTPALLLSGNSFGFNVRSLYAKFQPSSFQTEGEVCMRDVQTHTLTGQMTIFSF